MRRWTGLLFGVCAALPVSAKCGGVDYSWGADALALMHDYVVTMMLYVLYLLYAIAAIVAIYASLQIYIKNDYEGGRHHEGDNDGSRCLPVHHRRIHRVPGVLRLPGMTGRNETIHIVFNF